MTTPAKGAVAPVTTTPKAAAPAAPASGPTPAAPAKPVAPDPTKRLRYPKDPRLATPAKAPEARKFQEMVNALKNAGVGVPRKFVRKAFTVSTRGLTKESMEEKDPAVQSAKGSLAMKELVAWASTHERAKPIVDSLLAKK